MQPSRPIEYVLAERHLELPPIHTLHAQHFSRGSNTPGLSIIDLIPSGHRTNAAFAGIFMSQAPKQIVQQSFPERAIGNLQ